MKATCRCDQVVLDTLAAHDATIEIKVSSEPLSNPYGFEDLGLTCPHGVRWYAIPSGFQVAKWRQEPVR